MSGGLGCVFYNKVFYLNIHASETIKTPGSDK